LRIGRHLSYANVTATLALFVALGGGAYAVDKVGSSDIRNGSVRSIDIHRNTVRGKDVKEQTLDASKLAPVVGSEPGDCNPTSSAFINCASVLLRLKSRSQVLAIATGGQVSDSGLAKAECQVRIDGAATPLEANPGEDAVDNTSSGATNGFARTIVTPDVLSVGNHTVALTCNEFTPNVRIANPTIAAIAIGAP
jgi:hypothetical protein